MDKKTNESQLIPFLPALPLDAWQDTYTTLHLFTQIVGKIRLALSPMENHWWQVTLYPAIRGLTTSPMSYRNIFVQIDFDFIDHSLKVQDNHGQARILQLEGLSVAGFYRQLMKILSDLGVEVSIWPVPVEVEEQIPFDQDEKHAIYSPEAAARFWQALLPISQVLKVFRARFTGKSSPVHFFWGSFDLATTRFSGRRAPLNENAFHVARYVMKEAYFNECSSFGFWPGEGLGEPAFYAYHYPMPPGYGEALIQPPGAYYNTTMNEFILPYETARNSPDWQESVLTFFESAYEAGASLAQWDRAALEHSFLIGEKR